MMAGVIDSISVIIAFFACMFAIAGTLSLFRFPDCYTRLQASSLASSTAPFTIFLLSLVNAADMASAFRILLIMLFFLVSSPTTTHIISRYAWFSGIIPWIKSGEKP
jgi:multicomponent Na+:H+ antiporter subunit G